MLLPIYGNCTTWEIAERIGAFWKVQNLIINHIEMKFNDLVVEKEKYNHLERGQ